MRRSPVAALALVLVLPAKAVCSQVSAAPDTGPPAALTWRVTLAGLTLGTLRYEARATGPALGSVVSQTPLGVFEGSFSAAAERRADGSIAYVSASRTTRRTRDISFVIDPAGRVRDVQVTPPDQRTPLSAAVRVPRGVIDPASAFARLVSPPGGDCPEGFALYDGRRVVRVSLTGQRRRAGRLVCRMRYGITAGPGHLSPLMLEEFRLEVEYAPAPDAGLILDRLKLRAGLFTLRLGPAGVRDFREERF